MIQRSTILCLLIAMLGGYALFQITTRAQQLEEELARLNREIAEDRETIHVLRAEWAYLSQPALLRDRSANHLNLVPIRPRQVVRFEDLPARPVLAADMLVEGHVEASAQVVRTGGAAR